MQWYYVLNGERAGPVSQEQFDQLAQAGTIKAGTLVWHTGMAAQWLPWAQVSGATSPESDSAVCAVSGRVYPKREMLEYQGQWVGNEHKDVFFQRIREGLPVGAAGEMRYAGFWVRFVAAFLDGLIIGAINLMIAGVFMVLTVGTAGLGGTQGVNGSSVNGLAILLMLVRLAVQYVIAIGYDVFFIRKYDATPGKMALGLKVLRADGGKLSAGRIIGRYFSKIVSALILCIGYMMAGWDEQKRALHDMMCDTRVMYK